MIVNRYEYEGHPVLVIMQDWKSPIKLNFGLSKAKLILEALPDIQKFVADCERGLGNQLPSLFPELYNAFNSFVVQTNNSTVEDWEKELKKFETVLKKVAKSTEAFSCNSSLPFEEYIPPFKEWNMFLGLIKEKFKELWGGKDKIQQDDFVKNTPGFERTYNYLSYLLPKLNLICADFNGKIETAYPKMTNEEYAKVGLRPIEFPPWLLRRALPIY